jgi:hypothetical protein
LRADASYEAREESFAADSTDCRQPAYWADGLTARGVECIFSYRYTVKYDRLVIFNRNYIFSVPVFSLQSCIPLRFFAVTIIFTFYPFVAYFLYYLRLWQIVALNMLSDGNGQILRDRTKES